ncbi:MAG: hypothetical protein HPY46_01490 [Candidatus Aminicenantes bacterium]|uniref:Uncharacterized protein n=1 Tax=Candidatus Saccharicenans subterraneus TaxID=2508984 RepID=A0A3E2BIU8_9BACT|nr:hypothetical protein [Candidatus Aminicenantes bacterium]RFT14669.1 MAG: hypothetical protein OP8BY_2495 [Candidatus Saccharicenans subterraneum]
MGFVGRKLLFAEEGPVLSGKRTARFKVGVIGFLFFLVLSAVPGVTMSLAAAPQTGEITRLEAEATELENRAARLKQAVENCRRSISPQSPDCYIEISWLGARVSYLEAEKIAGQMEEQARDIRRRIDYLKSQLNRPAPPPPITTQPTTPVSPPVTGTPTTGNQTATRPVQTTPATPAPAPPAARPQPFETRVGGLSQKEWNRLMSIQERLEELYRDYASSDQAEVNRLRDEVYRLWQKAVSGPLTPEQRKMLRLRLPSRSQPAGPVQTRREELLEKRNQSSPTPPPSPLSVASNLVQSHIETGAQQALDEFGNNWVDVINVSEVDRKWLNYENVVGFSKVTMKLKEKDYPGAIAETVDFIAGKVMLPLTSMNVSVFKSVYGQTTFGALNKFMEDSMKMTGAEFSYEEMTKDMTLGQKAVMEWVGFGEMMREKDKEREKR